MFHDTEQQTFIAIFNQAYHQVFWRKILIYSVFSLIHHITNHFAWCLFLKKKIFQSMFVQVLAFDEISLFEKNFPKKKKTIEIHLEIIIEDRQFVNFFKDIACKFHSHNHHYECLENFKLLILDENLQKKNFLRINYSVFDVYKVQIMHKFISLTWRNEWRKLFQSDWESQK